MDCSKSGTNNKGVRCTHLKSLNMPSWKSPAPPFVVDFQRIKNGDPKPPFSPQTRLKSLEISFHEGSIRCHLPFWDDISTSKKSLQWVLDRLFARGDRKSLNARCCHFNCPECGPNEADEKVELQKGVHGTCCWMFEREGLIE